jgi:phosphoglycerate dehydrogenase-like enzyme
MAGLFYVAKPYAAAAANQKSAKWVHTVAQPLTGKTLGILGLGAIGAEVARMASAFGMKVIGTKRRPENIAHVAEVLPSERTKDVMAQSDFLLLLLPATPDTNSMINSERLGWMKPTAWLLNFGRGHLIKDDDLIAAVKAKKIAGAVLDVFRQEPLPGDHPFWSTEGILVLPHIGGPHPQRDRFVAKLFVDNLGRFLDGKPLKETVDRAVGY